MRANYTLARLYIDAPLDGEIELGPEYTHYLTRVLRLSIGDRVRLFNGREGEVAAEITEIVKKSLTLTVKDTLRLAYTPPPVTLFFAPLKRHRTSTLLEKATELGVTLLQPVITARTQFPKLNLEKMRTQIIEAAEQTERLDLPHLAEAKPLLEAISAYPSPLLMGDEGGAAAPMLSVLDGLSPPLGLVIGPEGGWSPEEREALRAMDQVTPVTLGPRILRADTAAISMLSLVQATVGDWRDS